jgi:hypothetical protein
MWMDYMSRLVTQPVTAAYTTITSRLGVIVTRLLAAAFWLGVENRCYCRRKTDRRLNLAT